MPEILDVCCGSRMFYFDRNNSDVVFCDNRQETCELCDGRKLEVKPDIVSDFRYLPFQDATFSLVIFDPPHLERVGLSSWLRKKYGFLDRRSWPQNLRNGFLECWRVLKENGTLIFKWNETQIPLSSILKCFEPIKPLLGHTTKHNLKTHWMTFFKVKME